MTVPNVTPVRFDDAAAGDAAWQLELSANAIMQAIQAFQGQLPATTQDWAGVFRGSFDEEAGAVVFVSLEAASEMLAVASRIRALQAEADATNALYNAQLAQQATQP